MGAFLVVFALYAVIILAFHLALAAGLVINFRRERRLHEKPALPDAHEQALLPLAEVVVAVRDEETTLPRLLASLRAQTLAGCLFLFVDDRSTSGLANAASFTGCATTREAGSEEPAGRAAADRNT